jgi:hypothetical protein
MDPRSRAQILLSTLAKKAGNAVNATKFQLDDTVAITKKLLDGAPYPARDVLADVTALWVNGVASLVLVPMGLPIPGGSPGHGGPGRQNDATGEEDDEGEVK